MMLLWENIKTTDLHVEIQNNIIESVPTTKYLEIYLMINLGRAVIYSMLKIKRRKLVSFYFTKRGNI